MKQRKVLFIGHDASRTGAPLLLLETVKWLKNNSNIQPSVLLKSSGELLPEFSAVAYTRCYRNQQDSVWKFDAQLHRRVLHKLKLAQKPRLDLNKIYSMDEYPVVYANTIASLDLAEELAGKGRRLIQHIHELSFTAEFYKATDSLRGSIRFTHSYIAASNAVRDFLENQIGVPASKIEVIHEFPVAIPQTSTNPEKLKAIRQKLGIPENAFVIGMFGSPTWRKGTDLFVQLAFKLTQSLGPESCHLVWLGGDENSHLEARYDAKRLGIENSCHFIKSVPEPGIYYSLIDVFALTSREDPFSVAMLEAALNALPIVCFANAGGGPELVEEDAGIVVPYLDVGAMAEACIKLYKNTNLRSLFGLTAQAKVKEHYVLEKQVPKIIKMIEAALSAC